MDVAPHAGPGSDELYGAAQTISGGANNEVLARYVTIAMSK